MVNEFKYRWNNYKERKYCMQRHLYEHFNLPGYSGFLKDVSDVSEYCWIHILKIKASLGLNVKDGLQAQIIVFFFTDYVYERTVFE